MRMITLSNMAYRLLVIAAEELVGDLDELLSGHDFGGVEAAVDPYNGLAFRRQCVGLLGR